MIVGFRDRWIIMVFLGLVILTFVATQTKTEMLTDKCFTLFDLLETIIDSGLSDERLLGFVNLKEKDLAQFGGVP